MTEVNQAKRMRVMLISLAILFGCIFLYKLAMNLLFKYAIKHSHEVVTVSVMKAGKQFWQPRLISSGSLRAINGVNVTTELAGMVQKIYFTPGMDVNKGDLLVQLNADAEIGQLQSLQAQQALAVITYNRDLRQFAVRAVSQQQVDTDLQNLKNLNGQVAQQAATVAKKQIRAPFAGRLGVNNVNLGQYINTGDNVVMLQTLSPIWADFYVPQQAIGQLSLKLNVIVLSDTFSNKEFKGTITTINPGVDVSTRNVLAEATIENKTGELKPGMFVTVQVYTGLPQKLLTLPQAAISFNPYGDVVYLVHESGKDKKGKPILTAQQTFVTTGERRGDQIVILKGIKEGDTVVTSGQLKLKNGSEIAINNSIVPSDAKAPAVPNDH